jgi:hypothetical protein
MPKKLMQMQEPVELSILTFNLEEKEDIFLTYTWERSEGPDIRRTGKGPPYMGLIGGQPGEITTHDFGLRLGTWLIREEMRETELEEAQRNLDNARRGRSTEADIQVLEQTIEELKTIAAHDQKFLEAYPELEILGFQGCGDLTMNEWNVAYINNALAETQSTLIYLPQELLEERIYTCLIKWKADQNRPSRLTIQEVRFNRRCSVRVPNELIWVQYNQTWIPVGDLIDFAVSNQQVIRDGEIVPVVTTCYQFGDLRHLLHMPNLNPQGPLYQGEPQRSPNNHRPRQYFNKDQYGDIWLGEETFLRDETQNLLRTALSSPVFLDFPPDANEMILRSALEREEYEEVSNALQPLSPGKWRFVSRGPQVTILEIFFKRNNYGWTMIGLSQDNRRIYCLSCRGNPGKTDKVGKSGQGYILEDAARFLLNQGVYNALLMDEGKDVFQAVREADGSFTDMVPRDRKRLRATFIFAHPAQPMGEA